MIPQETREVLNYIQWQRVAQELDWGRQRYHPKTWTNMLRAACQDAPAPDGDPATYALAMIEIAAVATAAVENLLQTDDRAAVVAHLNGWAQQIGHRWEATQHES